MGTTHNNNGRISLSGIFLLAIFTVLIFLGSTGISLAPETARIARISTPESESRSLRDFSESAEHLALGEKEPYGNKENYFLTTPAVVNGCSLNSSHPGSSGTAYIDAENFEANGKTPLTTAAVVSAKKAAEFTLLGAKPSGTS